jgi:hypothetical protein
VLIRSSVIPILDDDPVKLPINEPINDVVVNALVEALKLKLESTFKGVDEFVDDAAINGIYNDVLVVSVVTATFVDVVDVFALPEHEVDAPLQEPVRKPTNEVVLSAFVKALYLRFVSSLSAAEFVLEEAAVNATHKFVDVLSFVNATFIDRVATDAVPFTPKYLELNNISSSYIEDAFKLPPLISNKYNGLVLNLG